MTKMRSRFSLYGELAKSGIVTLVVISALGGYLIGYPIEKTFDFVQLLLALAGLYCLASGSSALNQLQERFDDAKMERTAARPIPSGRISVGHAAAFIVIALILGVVLLACVNWQVMLLGILAIISYNGFYTMWWKRKWAHGAIPGAIPGALPVLIGYVAATGKTLSPVGLYLFLVLLYWQLPHYWSLAIRYREDYRKGGFPTLPVARGNEVTVRQITVWCLGYVALALAAPLFLKVQAIYFVTAFVISLKVLWELFAFARQPESKRWVHFFVWVNFSLIIYIGALAADLWSVYLKFLWV